VLAVQGNQRNNLKKEGRRIECEEEDDYRLYTVLISDVNWWLGALQTQLEMLKRAELGRRRGQEGWQVCSYFG
jgi:hypothetical protein